MLQRMIGSSSFSTGRRMARTFAKRGTVDVANRLGTCLGCHGQAQAQWDLVCENTHGCPPIDVTRAMIGALQRTDPRCVNPPVSPEDAEALKQLQQLPK
jgi:hypothetical protein